MNRPPPKFARWDDVIATFRSHVEHYVAHGGGENALVGLRAEGAVTVQYAGRVVYELFQNALDRAQSRAVVKFTDGLLLVGNDGDGVQVDPDYVYENPIEGEGRSDFHALCALHTSNKSADRQFGNKGIGFRSVFGVADHVRLWSRCHDGGWWGMELRQRLVPTDWPGSALAELDSLVIGAGRQPRPSFHFPRLLRSAEAPSKGCSDISTIVLVNVVDNHHRLQIDHEVERLRNTRFQFVGLRRPNIHFHINGDIISSESGWSLVSQAHHHAGSADLAELARQADHPVEKPKVGVAWADGVEVDGQRQTGLFYNHLPTRMSTGLPVDIHGDFQVKADREGMALSSDNAVGAYNLALLQLAADAHMEALRAESLRASVRSDFWALADRPHDAPPAWTSALKNVFFPSGSFDVWVALATSYFRAEASESTCRSFWNSSRRWLVSLAGYGDWTKTWADLARMLCDQLVQAGVPTIPVVADEGARTVALPSRQEPGYRAERRVFFWSPRGGAAIPKVPEVLLEMGRVVTSFDLGQFEGPAGIQPFAEAELLPELRQVPNDPAALDVADALSPTEQAKLLLFAYHLTASRRVPERHFAWRAFADSQDGERIGRALATMFLPTTEGLWEPGRQLSIDSVNTQLLAELMGHPEGLSEFLTLLGVAPRHSISLVEGGSNGRVPALSSPPRPQEAGRVPQIPPLEPVLPPGTSPSAVVFAVQGLPPDSQRSRVHEVVRSLDWIDSARFRSFDGVPPLRPFIAPLDVVLHTHDPQRVFFGVPQAEDDMELLRSLGALNRPDDEACVGRVAEVLRGLRDRIPRPADLPSAVGLSLAALFNRLVARLDDEDRNVPTLTECAGRLVWLRAGTEAWVARREERQELRRFFPDLALAAAEYRDGLPEKLSVGLVRLRKRVRPEVDRGTATPRSSSIRDRIDPHLPVLAAVADQSRQAMRTLSVERLRRAWQLQHPVIEVPDAWVEIRVEGPDREPISWRKGEFDDVFHQPSSVDEDPGVVVFDVHPRSKDDPNWRLPLHYFGDALASLLVSNAALGPLFSQVLASIDEDRLNDFIERNHLDALVREWSSRLSPLSEDQREILEGHIAKLCTDPGSVLRAGRISAEDLRPDVPFAGARELEAWLRQEVPEQLATYLPALVIASDNQLAWQRWLDRRRSALAALVDALGRMPSAWRRELQNEARQGWDSMKFDAASIAAGYLSQYGHRIDDLDQRLDEIAPTFSPVRTTPLPLSQTGWHVGRGRSGAGHGGPHQKLTTEDLVEESLARGAIGDAAELALLSWVVEQVEGLRDVDGFEDALLSVFKPNTKTWREVKEAVRSGDLPSALHIASRWSGAGFDVLGLERTEAGLVPVRYECKGISTRTQRIRVHLSRNELGVARRVLREGTGKWLLVGVQPDGVCVDLTSLLADLLDESEKPLEPLYQRGLEPDGLRLVVERPDATGAADGQ